MSRLERVKERAGTEAPLASGSYGVRRCRGGKRQRLEPYCRRGGHADNHALRPNSTSIARTDAAKRESPPRRIAVRALLVSQSLPGLRWEDRLSRRTQRRVRDAGSFAVPIVNQRNLVVPHPFRGDGTTTSSRQGRTLFGSQRRDNYAPTQRFLDRWGQLPAAKPVCT